MAGDDQSEENEEENEEDDGNDNDQKAQRKKVRAILMFRSAVGIIYIYTAADNPACWIMK